MRINTNMNAMTALNQATKNTALAGASMEKLSSGLRINKAGDDAAGLAISEKMRSQIRGMEQASRNTQDGISLVQTAEGAMEEIGNITQRMRELSVQAASDTNQTEDRNKIQAEIQELTAQIDQIAGSTKFNGENLLTGGGFSPATIGNGKGASSVSVSKDYGAGAKITSTDDGGKLKITITNDANETYTQSLDVAASAKNGVLEFDKLGVKIELKAGEAVVNADIIGNAVDLNAGGTTKGITIQTGANISTNEEITISIDKADSAALGIDALAVTDQTKAKAAVQALDGALEKINSSRAKLGAMQNRLEYTDSNLTSVTENLSAAESRIRDVDVAKEMMNLSKLNLLNQASQAMMSQAKSQPEGVMQLLR